MEEKVDRPYSKGALKLLLTAERLFGESGIDNVSLRQIVTAAGQANSYAVQHHFGSKKGLIQAVFDMRVPSIEIGRARRLEAAKDKVGNTTVTQLLGALYMPIVEDLDETAQRSCALFSSRLMQVESADHPIQLSKVPQPARDEIRLQLRRHFAYLPSEVFRLRIRLTTDLFLSGVEEKRLLKQSKNNPYPTDEPFWNELLLALEALLRLPYTVPSAPD